MDEKIAKRTNLEDYLQHRSGYGDYRYLPRLSGATREEGFRRLKHLEPEGEFRKKLICSNLGYTMAGYVVGVAGGTSYNGTPLLSANE